MGARCASADTLFGATDEHVNFCNPPGVHVSCVNSARHAQRMACLWSTGPLTGGTGARGRERYCSVLGALRSSETRMGLAANRADL
jgi:hypothetical protein